MYKQLPYNAVEDFSFISMLTENPFILVTYPDHPAKTIADVIKTAQADPGKLTYATAGNGTGMHLASELLVSMGKAKIQHVPYRGSPQAITDLIAKRVDFQMDTPQLLLPFLSDRRVRAIAVTGPLTLVLERPDGVEYRRATVGDQGLGGRSFSAPLNAAAASGTWRVRAFTDPKRPAVGETTFMVEDYVADRMEFELSSSAARMSREGDTPIALSGRYLYGAPAGDLTLEGEVTISAANWPACRANRKQQSRSSTPRGREPATTTGGTREGWA